jgi:predicted nucleic acid-binding protein
MIEPPPLILLDTCCLLNLYASGIFKDILELYPKQFAVVDYILEKEALFIRKNKDDIEEFEKIDLEPYIASQQIKVLSINNMELETYIDYASELDDGEAITIALAIHRYGIVATDDHKALKIISQILSLRAMSTLEFIKHWSNANKKPINEIRDTLINMLEGANYYPGDRDSLFEWWKSIINNIEYKRAT